jgi:hypothetical protein
MNEKDANRFDESTEELTEAARESYRAAVNQTFAARESNMRLARSFFEDWVDTLETQAEVNRRALQGLANLAREQQEVFQELSRRSFDAYDGFLDSLFSYYGEVQGEAFEEGEPPVDD